MESDSYYLIQTSSREHSGNQRPQGDDLVEDDRPRPTGLGLTTQAGACACARLRTLLTGHPGSWRRSGSRRVGEDRSRTETPREHTRIHPAPTQTCHFPWSQISRELFFFALPGRALLMREASLLQSTCVSPWNRAIMGLAQTTFPFPCSAKKKSHPYSRGHLYMY